MKVKKMAAMGTALTMALLLTACGGSQENADAVSVDLPSIDSIHLGTDYQNVTASIKVLTNRTDIVDTVYKGYAEQFMKLYPNITVEYEAVTDYEQALNLRLPTGDWGDICYIPTSVAKSEMSEYFSPLGDFATLNEIYNFLADKNYGGIQYGIPNGGTAGGVIYNKRIWKEAGIEKLPATPDEFLDCLQKIKDNTDAIPLYTNFAAGWPMGAWDQYIGVTATGDPDFMLGNLAHTKDPFAKKDDMSGPYAVYYTLYEAVSRKLVEDDPASSDWEASKGMINKGEIATMVLGSWAVEQCRGAGAAPEDVGYMPFPITVDGKRYASGDGNYSYAINNKATEENQIASMVYLKWLLEESTIFVDEGTIPALKSEPLPDSLSEFDGVEILSNNPAIEGEENLFDDVNNESEVGINNNDYPDCEILDTLMAEWNAKWTAAQESLGVDILKY